MVLIVDSGSTKSDWVLLKEKEDRLLFKTMGFNPFFHNETIIANAVKQNSELFEFADRIEQVFYYGAGCSSEGRNAIVRRALKRVFSKAEVNVDHDLLACAYSTYAGVPAISCILGTGSNSCYYDGINLVEKVPALGYVLGDEGGGSYFGKKLLTAYLYGQLPVEVAKDLEETFEIDKDGIIENVYSLPHANVFLASFMRFIAKHKDVPFIDHMIVAGLKDFMNVHVCCYDDYEKIPVHFIGSIGYFFEDQLKRAAQDTGIELGTITRKPIDGLVNYHLEHLPLTFNTIG